MTSPATNHHRAGEIRRPGRGPRPIPPAGYAGPIAEPPNVDTSLPNGLRVITVRQSVIPMVELRLWIPFASWETRHSVRAELLATTMAMRMAGCDDTLAPEGGSLTADVSPERLLITGRVLARGLSTLLETLAGLLVSPAYIGDEVTEYRQRLVKHIRSMETWASAIARRALQKCRFGDHPIADEIPSSAEIASVTPRELGELHMAAVVPRGATLVLVGDIDVDEAAHQAGSALKDWTSGNTAKSFSSLPVITADSLLFVSNVGAAESRFCLSAQAMGRTDPRYPATVLANLILGGSCSSRLGNSLPGVGTGPTRSVESFLELHADTGSVVIEVDSAGPATAEVLNETLFELGRLIYQPPDEAEVAAAREYALGTLHCGLATQAGLAAQLAALAGAGLGVPWLLTLHSLLRDTTQFEVTQVVLELFAPANWTGVVVACPVQFPELTMYRR